MDIYICSNGANIFIYYIWQRSLIGFYLVALRTAYTETVSAVYFLFPEAAKFKYATKIVTLVIKIELSEVKENLWRSYLNKRATTSNSVQIQNLSRSFDFEGFCRLVDLCILLKWCSSISVDISFFLKKILLFIALSLLFLRKKKQTHRH